MNFYVIASVAALGGLLFGYDTGVISGALIFIRQVMSLSPSMQGVVVTVALAGAAMGAAMVGYLSDRAGRRQVILGAGLLFIAGAAISAIAQTVAVLVIGRFLVGLAIGIASMLTPLYLAEISPARERGAIVSLNQLCITAGILVSISSAMHSPVPPRDGAGCWRSGQYPASCCPPACWFCRKARVGSPGKAGSSMQRTSSGDSVAAQTCREN